MIFSTVVDAGTLTFRVEGELDALSVPQIRPELDQIVARGPTRVVMDLSALRLIDSSGVGAIVSLYKRIKANGGQVVVNGLRDQPLAIVRVLGLDRVFDA
jgi:anti-sigma B factor antagonist